MLAAIRVLFVLAVSAVLAAAAAPPPTNVPVNPFAEIDAVRQVKHAYSLDKKAVGPAKVSMG